MGTERIKVQTAVSVSGVGVCEEKWCGRLHSRRWSVSRAKRGTGDERECDAPGKLLFMRRRIFDISPSLFETDRLGLLLVESTKGGSRTRTRSREK